MPTTLIIIPHLTKQMNQQVLTPKTVSKLALIQSCSYRCQQRWQKVTAIDSLLCIHLSCSDRAMAIVVPGISFANTPAYM